MTVLSTSCGTHPLLQGTGQGQLSERVCGWQVVPVVKESLLEGLDKWVSYDSPRGAGLMPTPPPPPLFSIACLFSSQHSHGCQKESKIAAVGW